MIDTPQTPTPKKRIIHDASGILAEASNIVQGARNTTHGEKERSFDAIARLWNAYLGARAGVPDKALSGADVAHMMILMKMARAEWGVPIRDHFVDMAGYAGIAGELSVRAEG